jgi:hypothetical protein
MRSSRRSLYRPLFFSFSITELTFIVLTRPLDLNQTSSANDDKRALTMIGNANIFFRNPRKVRPGGRIQAEVGASETTSTSFLHPTVGCSPKQCLRTFYGITSTIRSLKCSEITERRGKQRFEGIRVPNVV